MFFMGCSVMLELADGLFQISGCTRIFAPVESVLQFGVSSLLIIIFICIKTYIRQKDVKTKI